MPRISLLLLLAFTWAIAPAHAGAKHPKKAPDSVEEPANPTQTPRTYDFAGEDISQVLRTLARDAKMNIVAADDVAGPVNMRFEDKSLKDALEIIVESKDLVMKQGKGGVYFIRSKNPPPPRPPDAPSPKAPDSSTDLSNAKDLAQLAQILVPVVTGYYDSMLDFQARPETASKVAKAKKALYDALVAEGFTKEEAFRIILTSGGLPTFDPGK